MNYLSSSARSSVEIQQPALPAAWLPVFLGLAVISVESTRLMGAANTGRWLLELCHSLWGQTDGESFEAVHIFLRKLGHFVGYGTLGVMFWRGWYRSVCRFSMCARSELRVAAAGLAIASTCGIALIDEWHQSFLPGRVSCLSDVAIDTCGAILFNGILLFVIVQQRRALVNAEGLRLRRSRG